MLKIGSVAVLHQQTYLAYFSDWLQYKPCLGLSEIQRSSSSKRRQIFYTNSHILCKVLRNWILFSVLLWLHGWGLMYVCVCTVARGSSGNEILFPCQIKASAPIKCYSGLWSLLTWCTGFLRTEENRRDGGQEDTRGWTLTRVLAFTTKLTEWALTALSHVQCTHTLCVLHKMDSMTNLGEKHGGGKHVCITGNTCSAACWWGCFCHVPQSGTFVTLNFCNKPEKKEGQRGDGGERKESFNTVGSC